MPLLANGIEAWITLENKVQVLELRPELDTETNTATCWINGESGQPFVLRWRDTSDPITTKQSDYAGFVSMDGYEVGGRVLVARTHAAVMFSQIPISSTTSAPLTFPHLPTGVGIGPDWVTMGTICLTVYLAEVGASNGIHQGYQHYYRKAESPPRTCSQPHTSTEVTNMGKVATFIFKFRPLAVLQEHGIAPATVPHAAVPRATIAPAPPPRVAVTGDKRPAPERDLEECESLRTPISPDTPSFYICGSSDSDDSRPFRVKPRRLSKSYTTGPQAKRPKISPN